ncbi:MAG: pitrilysin family protein [Candidatus Eisenbacteria bacterium]
MCRSLNHATITLLVLLIASSAYPTEIRLPEFRTVQLPNGMVLHVGENHSVPAVTVSVVLPCGYEYDPPGKRGLARTTAEACYGGGIPGMEDGPQGGLMRLGSQITRWTDYDGTVFSMTSISSNWKAALDILAKIIRVPILSKREITRQRDASISATSRNLEQPASLARLNLLDLLYEGPLSEPPTVAAAKSISRDDVVGFHSRHYLPNRAILVAIGDFNANEAIEVLRGAFDDWPKGNEPPEAPQSRLRIDGPRVLLVDKPDLTQATIWCGHAGLQSSDPDRFAFAIANTALGGHFNSRLQTRLRSEGGLTYHAGSFHSGQLRHGQFIVSTYTRNEELGCAIHEIGSVLADFTRSGMTPDEFGTARNYLLGNYLIYHETPQQVTEGLIWALAMGHSIEDYAAEPAHFEAVTLEEANRAMASHITPDRMVWVIVADKDKIGSALDALGDYETVYYKDSLNPR